MAGLSFLSTQTKSCSVVAAYVTRQRLLVFAFIRAMRPRLWRMRRGLSQRPPKSCAWPTSTSRWPCSSSSASQSLHLLSQAYWRNQRALTFGTSTQTVTWTNTAYPWPSWSRPAFGSSQSWILCPSRCLSPLKWSTSSKRGSSRSTSRCLISRGG